MNDLQKHFGPWVDEKCWSIIDNLPVKVFYKKDWTGRYYRLEPDAGTMSYTLWESLGTRHLTDVIKVNISSYNYESGKCCFIANNINDIKEWAKHYEGEVLVFPEEERKSYLQKELNFN